MQVTLNYFSECTYVYIGATTENILPAQIMHEKKEAPDKNGPIPRVIRCFDESEYSWKRTDTLERLIWHTQNQIQPFVSCAPINLMCMCIDCESKLFIPMYTQPHPHSHSCGPIVRV